MVQTLNMREEVKSWTLAELRSFNPAAFNEGELQAVEEELELRCSWMVKA
jgi:hypothetical protein